MIELYNVKGVSLTREQLIEVARRAKLTVQELTPPAPAIVKETAYERHLVRSDGVTVRLLKTQDSKYYILAEPVEAGQTRASLANGATGIEIPADEPVMIFRGQDVHARAALSAYCLAVTADSTAVSPQTGDTAQAKFMEFCDFANTFPQRMKAPT